jgi:hypothetical protein
MHSELREAMVDGSARATQAGGEARERRPALTLGWGHDERVRRPQLRGSWRRAS